MSNIVKLAGHSFDVDLLPERATVLDVGCRGFDFTQGIRDLRPRALIYAMDPDPMIVPPIGLCAFYAKALVSDPLRIRSNYASYSTGEGNFLTDLTVWGDAKIIQVGCYTITDMLRMTAKGFFDLVKLDIEGSEFQVLENWPGPIARQVSVEFHDFDKRSQYPDSYYERLFAKLHNFGYRVVQHELSDISGRGAIGHWDDLLILEA